MSSPSVRRDLNRPSQKNIPKERVYQPNFRPNFVRLDSSGEDNYSTKQYTQQKITMCKSCEARPKSNISCSGMKRNNVFDTATSYVNTAGAYLSEICQYTSANTLARKVGGRSVLNYLNKFGSPSVCDKTSVPFPSEVTTSMPVNNQAPVMSSALSYCIMDALKGRLANTSLSSPDIKASASTTKYEPYKPPHIKCIRNGSVLVDPCLTPYNARLLMKSKQCHQSRSVSPEIPHLRKECKESQHGREKLKDSESLKDFVVVQEKTKMPEKQLTQIDVSKTDQISEADGDGLNIPLGTSAMNKNKTNFSRKVEDRNIVNNQKVDGINAVLSKKIEDMDVKCNQVKDVDEKSIIGEDDVKDWFDHVNSDFKCIPISIKLDDNCSEEEEPLSSSLHNWFSIERDPTVKKEENVEISSQCDNAVSANETDKASRSMLVTENSCCDKTLLHQANKDTDSNVSDVENSKQCQGNISVLYVRNMSKKSRPSSKKRRRHKKQQKEGDANENQDKKKSLRKKVVSIATTSTPNNSKSSNNSIAFILGLEPSHDSSDIEFDSDLHNSSSDWSDSSDFECDGEDFVDGFDESQNWMSDIMCPVNFQITCSLVNSQEIPSTTSSHLDDINLSWKVNLAMSPKQSRKRNSDKKVHFASADHLATVHPMVTWSHAYQAARKGPWEEYARDRGRFQRRITDLQRTLDPVLDPVHRETVFNQRYNKNAL